MTKPQKSNNLAYLVIVIILGYWLYNNSELYQDYLPSFVVGTVYAEDLDKDETEIAEKVTDYCKEIDNEEFTANLAAYFAALAELTEEDNFDTNTSLITHLNTALSYMFEPESGSGAKDLEEYIDNLIGDEIGLLAGQPYNKKDTARLFLVIAQGAENAL